MNMRNLCVASLAASLGVCGGANAQEQSFFAKGPAAPVIAPYTCKGPVNLVVDVADENLHTTTAVFGTTPGGGEGKQFDKTPVLTTKVTLRDGQCLDAHLTAIVGGPNFYGKSSLALFQVALTGPVGPVHMYGHYETPYGISSPAVALGAEPDVDMLGANFIQHVGTGTHDVPPGNYTVKVYWAGAPNAGGAIGAAFVLKLYASK
ncbi:MAG TPA: hypothetical protein VFV07_05315 [Rhizomicrobium sp.]|nr:hypothetical protein [Rhizomicrobium sp.]